jgi:hypothetical protein
MSNKEVVSSLKAGKLTDEAIAVLTEVAAEVTKRHQA